MSTTTQRYYEVGDSTLSVFNESVQKMALPMKINFRVVGDSKLKSLIKIAKVSPIYEFMTEQQIIVYINEDLLDNLSDDSAVELLFREGLNGIQPNLETGVIKIEKPNTATFRSIIDKFGLEEVNRAKDLERMTLEQTDEKEREEVTFS